MKKILFAVAVLVAITLAGLAVLILRLDPEVLGADLIAQINRQGGIHLRAERISLHPWRGLELENARATGSLESGNLTAELRLLRMRHRLVPLLRGELIVHEVLLQSPRIELSSTSALQARRQEARKSQRTKDKDRGQRRKKARQRRDSAQEAEPSVASAASGQGGARLRLSIERLAIEDGQLSIRSRNRQRASFEVADLFVLLEDLRIDSAKESRTEAVSARGRFSTGRISHDDLEALRSNGLIRLAEGVATLTELNVHSADADLMVRDLEVELLREPLEYTVEAAGGFDLNGALGVTDDRGFGSVGLVLTATGMGPELRELSGGGTLTLNAGAVPGLPSMLQIEDLLGEPLLTGREYDRTEIVYAIENNKLLLEPFEVIGDGAILGGRGEIDLAGPLDLDIWARFPRGNWASPSLDEEQMEPLRDADGGITIPFHVAGTADDPSLQLTWDGAKALAGDAAKSWAEDALEEVKKRAVEWLESRSDQPDEN